MGDMMRTYVPKHTMPWYMCSGLPLMRPPLGNKNSGRIRGWPLVRGKLHTFKKSLFSKIVDRVAIYKQTTI